MKMMKAVAVMAKGTVKVVDNVPVPTMGDYDALCRVHTCGFCSGTDFQIIHDKTEPQQGFSGFPTILGHEGVGEVIEVGKKVRHIKPGDRYIRPHLRDVGSGYTKTYGSMAQYGLVCDQKAMAEDGVCVETEVPFYKRQCAFPKTIPFEDAAVLLSLGECLSAAVNFGVKPGDRVLFYGAGPMGCALAMFMRLRGAGHITMIDGMAGRLANAARIAHADRTIDLTKQDVNAALAGEQFDLAVDAVGRSEILLEASGRLKPGGKVCALGVLKSGDCMLDMSRFRSNTCLHMLNFPYGEYDALPEIIQLVETGAVNPKDFYSHIVPFENIQEAMELVASRRAFKVVLDISGCTKH
ncbi:MAG: hypothetical protein EOM69_09930 [Clostridia bacterium]|nr:hypothetical protein [Clostridia bacterium]